jgi:hypothetical protein
MALTCPPPASSGMLLTAPIADAAEAEVVPVSRRSLGGIVVGPSLGNDG